MPSPLQPVDPHCIGVVVVLTIEIRIMTAVVPPGSVTLNRTVVGVGWIVVPVWGGERLTVMETQAVT